MGNLRYYPNGLKQAILAVSFFKSRHGQRLTYKKSKRHANDTVPVSYSEHARLTRKFIREARGYDFKGSVVDSVCGGVE